MKPSDNCSSHALSYNVWWNLVKRRLSRHGITIADSDFRRDEWRILYFSNVRSWTAAEMYRKSVTKS